MLQSMGSQRVGHNLVMTNNDKSGDLYVKVFLPSFKILNFKFLQLIENSLKKQMLRISACLFILMFMYTQKMKFHLQGSVGSIKY